MQNWRKSSPMNRRPSSRSWRTRQHADLALVRPAALAPASVLQADNRAADLRVESDSIRGSADLVVLVADRAVQAAPVAVDQAESSAPIDMGPTTQAWRART